MNMEEKVEREEEKKVEKERRGNRAIAISVMRVLLFVVLLLAGVGTAIFIGLYDYEDYWVGSKNKEEFYKTELFGDVLNSWAEHMCNFIQATGRIEKEQEKIDTDKKLYSLTEYSELTDKKLFDKNAVTKDTLPADTVTFSDLQAKDVTIADNITNGSDGGETITFYYDKLRNNLRELTGTEDIKGFIHLNGREFYTLLDKYCTVENLEQDMIKMQFAGGLELFAEDDTESYDDEDDYDGEELPYDGEPTQTSEENKGTDANINEPKGFYNGFNGNLIIYSYYGGEDGNGHFLLMAKDTLYDYAMRDVSISKDFYIPTELLDYSSRENFEKSLVTTPFSTVEGVMAYLSTQTIMQQNEEERWEHYWSTRTTNEFEYVVTYLDENHKEQVLANCDKSRMKSGYRLVYDKNKGTVTSDIPADYIKDADFFENFKELKEITKVEIRLDSGFGFNRLGATYLLSLAAAHKSGLLLAGVLFVILIFVLFVGITYLLPAKVYPRDCHFLLTKTIIYGAVAGAFGTAAVGLLYYVCYVGMHFTPVIRLIAVGIGFVFLLGVAYIAVTEYWFSIIRLINAKQFKQYLFLYCIYGKAVKGLKKYHHGLKQFFAEIRQTTSYAKRAVIKRVFLLLGLMLCLVFFIASMAAGAGVFALFFFLALCAVLVLEGRDIYQLVIDQKMLDKIVDGIQQLIDGDLSYKIDTEKMKGDKKHLAELVNHIADGLEKAVAQSIKDERLKAELITNVSHDIKTPLTSIINYVDLMKRENVSEEPLKGYIEVLEQKSQRLKQLTEDLVEASKASTGNIELEPVNLNMTELLFQTIGEFEDKFLEKSLTLVPQITEEEIVIFADGRRCYRIFENLFQNIYKYAMPNTRVYLSLEPKGSQVVLCLKNISESPLTMDVSELTGRFVRGDASRTTEGSGLGLSIAQSLTTLQNGSFQVELDGDLFKVTIVFERQKN